MLFQSIKKAIHKLVLGVVDIELTRRLDNEIGSDDDYPELIAKATAKSSAKAKPKLALTPGKRAWMTRRMNESKKKSNAAETPNKATKKEVKEVKKEETTGNQEKRAYVVSENGHHILFDAFTNARIGSRVRRRDIERWARDNKYEIVKAAAPAETPVETVEATA